MTIAVHSVKMHAGFGGHSIKYTGKSFGNMVQLNIGGSRIELFSAPSNNN